MVQEATRAAASCVFERGLKIGLGVITAEPSRNKLART
jgi:hypothetical protein